MSAVHKVSLLSLCPIAWSSSADVLDLRRTRNKVEEAWVSDAMEQHTRWTKGLQKSGRLRSHVFQIKSRELERGGWEREKKTAIRKCKFPKFFWVVIKGCVCVCVIFSTVKLCNIFIELQGTLNLFPGRQPHAHTHTHKGLKHNQ